MPEIQAGLQGSLVAGERGAACRDPRVAAVRGAHVLNGGVDETGAAKLLGVAEPDAGGFDVTGDGCGAMPFAFGDDPSRLRERPRIVEDPFGEPHVLAGAPDLTLMPV